MTPRDKILARLQSARATATVPLAHAPALVTPSMHPIDACLPRFEAEAAALGIECYVEHAPAAVRTRLATLVADRRVLSWRPEHVPYDAATVLTDAAYGDAPLDEQRLAEVGVTGCDVAVAETASCVMFSAPGRSRTVSLLPPFHIAVIKRSQLVFSMAEVFEGHKSRFRETASCTVVTGPSRTADIELTLTLGIHGPGRVAVIIGP